MSSRVYPYKGARVLREYRCASLPAGQWIGLPCRIRVYEDYASRGYQTDYQPVQTRWLEIEVQAQVRQRGMRQCWAYSGKRLEKAERDFDSNVRALEEAAATVAIGGGA